LISSIFAVFRGYKDDREKNDKIEQENLAIMEQNKQIAAQNKLKQLALQFVESEYKPWIKEMEKITLKRALKDAQVASNYQQFSVFAYDILYGKKDVTYIFSNGLISIIKGIVFNIAETSYSFVNSDNPNYSINQPSDWSNQEVYYQDVISINYEPANDTFTQRELFSSGSEVPIGGHIILGLSDGTKITIPATKDSSTNFVQTARQKVRSIKHI
jgi:hypothetical protein